MHSSIQVPRPPRHASIAPTSPGPPLLKTHQQDRKSNQAYPQSPISAVLRAFLRSYTCDPSAVPLITGVEPLPISLGREHQYFPPMDSTGTLSSTVISPKMLKAYNRPTNSWQSKWVTQLAVSLDVWIDAFKGGYVRTRARDSERMRTLGWILSW